MNTPTPQPASGFPVLLCLQEGLRLLATQGKPLIMMCVLPFAAIGATLAIAQLVPVEISDIELAAMLIPATFLLGIAMALITRWLVTGEHPNALEHAPELRDDRNIHVRNSAIAGAAVSFLYTGFFALVLRIMLPAMQAAESGAPLDPKVSLASFLALVIGISTARYLWLFVPVALGWDVRGFFRHVAGFGNAVRVFVLYGLCSILVSVPFGLIGAALSRAMPPIPDNAPMPPAMAILDSMLSAATITLQVLLFTCASAAAMRYLLNERKGMTV